MPLKFDYILRECPFCGSHRIYLVSGKGKFDRVQCDYCGATGPWFDGHPEDAIADWNSRSYEGIEEILVEMFEDDDSHVISILVAQIRDKLKDPNFALGANFGDKACDVAEIEVIKTGKRQEEY